MSSSLRSQLLQAGLVNKKQVNKAKHEQFKKKKQRAEQGAVAESKQLAQKALQAEKERTRQLNRELQQQKEQKEIVAQIGQMIQASKVKTGDGDITFYFADNNKIKKLYVTKAVREQLSRGQLAIVAHREHYEVVPAEVARKIADRDPAALLVLHEPKQKTAADDPYAEFPIPDDFEW